ncbi:hypothetical protein [Methylobacterium sp. A54F]
MSVTLHLNIPPEPPAVAPPRDQARAALRRHVRAVLERLLAARARAALS